MLYFSQLEWAELAPHKVTGKIFGWFRIPGPQRLICDGRPCPHLGSEVRRHHCPPDTGQLCAGHEAGKPLRPSRPSCPTHFQNLSCQKQPRPLAPQRVSSGACLEGPQRSFCGLVSCSHPGDVCSVCGSRSGPSRFPSRNPPTNFLLARLKCFPVSLPWLLFSPCLEHCSHPLHRAYSDPFPALYEVLLGASPPQFCSHRDHTFPRADSIHCLCPSLDN